jgi:hypothetical protein
MKCYYDEEEDKVVILDQIDIDGFKEREETFNVSGIEMNYELYVNEGIMESKFKPKYIIMKELLDADNDIIDEFREKHLKTIEELYNEGEDDIFNIEYVY